MGDDVSKRENNHSEGIWRSFIFMGHKIPKQILGYMAFSARIHFSWQRYWDQNGAGGDYMAIRAEIPLDEVETVREYVKTMCESEGIKWHERSWDEKIETKRAYELGSRIYALVDEALKERHIDHPEEVAKFLVSAFHGFWNNMNRAYSAECDFYIYALSKISHSIDARKTIHQGV